MVPDAFGQNEPLLGIDSGDKVVLSECECHKNREAVQKKIKTAKPHGGSNAGCCLDTLSSVQDAW